MTARVAFDTAFYESKFGIVLPPSVQQKHWIPEVVAKGRDIDNFAMDAQPTLVTQGNAGIPQFLTNYLDPRFIRILVSPMNASKIAGGETKKGSWTTKTAQFQLVESTGEVSSYGDYSTNGVSKSNYNWPSRQSYLFQTITQWGELELETAGEAKINYAADQNVASALTLMKFSNLTYFRGVAGLENYGLLNDPNLPAPIAPTSGIWPSESSDVIYSDIQTLFAQLVTQSNGLVNEETPMVLALSPGRASNLAKTNQYNVNVIDQIKKNYPNLRIVTAVEYATTAGQLMQLIAEEIDGVKTVECGFNEKMRAHPVVVDLSSWKQKKTSGTWGAIIYRTFLIAQMLGI